MGVLSDLIVAPLEARQSLLTMFSNERPYPWNDIKGVDEIMLSTLYAILSGLDPDAVMDSLFDLDDTPTLPGQEAWLLEITRAVGERTHHLSHRTTARN